MASLDRIRTEGFRRWYERQLIECHAWLVSCFLGMIAVASGMEVAGQAGMRPVGMAVALGGLVVAAWSWERYRIMLKVAEQFGEQAACPACLVYSRFSVTASGPAEMPDGGDPGLEKRSGGVWIRACCRKCGEEWTLH